MLTIPEHAPVGDYKDLHAEDAWYGFFPLEIERNQNIVYHGTSGIHEAKIDAEGFCWSDRILTRQDFRQVVETFRTLRWEFTLLPVLSSWSLENGFTADGQKGICFEVCSNKAAYYATRKNAGGESFYAVRECLNALDKYFNDRDYRMKERELYQSGELEYVIFSDFDCPLAMSDDELAAIIANLTTIREKAFKLLEEHSCGIVYAVDFKSFQPDKVETRGSVGYVVNAPVPASAIVAKVRLPADFKHRPCFDFHTFPS